MSHELKTPLTSIAGYARRLPVSRPAGGRLETILGNARRMQRRGRASFVAQSGSFSSPRVIGRAGGARRLTPFAERAASMEVGFEGRESRRARCRRPRAAPGVSTCRQRAPPPPPGSGFAWWRFRRRVRLSVEDSGSGIPATSSPASSSGSTVRTGAARRDGSSGLGLAIVKQVEAHGGHVEAESASAGHRHSGHLPRQRGLHQQPARRYAPVAAVSHG
jgi:signal transduction histidine kinase